MEKYKIFVETPLFNTDIDQEEPFVETYLLKGENNPCIIVCPGGAYCNLAEHEKYAETFNKMGLSVFVLNYRCYPYHYPCPVLDARRAVKFVKYNAKKFGINPDKVLIAGSSAGGHLALSTSCYIDSGNNDGDEIDKLSSDVVGTILCYPVVSLVEYTNGGTRNVFADGDTAVEYKFSIQHQVHPNMPPIFAWHTLNDNSVDVRNVLMLAESCHKENVPMELHIFPDGHHGLGTADYMPHVHQWVALCENWLKDNKFI